MRGACARLCGVAWAASVALAGCATQPVAPSPPPVAASSVVIERGWHTDVCLRGEEAGPALRRLAGGFEDVRWLCFGFGDRSYVVRRDHSLMTMAAALFPGKGVILMTALRATPAEGFGADHAVSLAVSQQGLESLRGALDSAVETGPDGTPVLLDHGPYDGSLYYSATATYSLAYTCNTWTADMLRRAGLQVGSVALFVNDVMAQARQIAAAQAPAMPIAAKP